MCDLTSLLMDCLSQITWRAVILASFVSSLFIQRNIVLADFVTDGAMNTSCDRKISASAMVSPGHVNGAASVMEESPRRACGKGERLGLGSLDNNEREKKRMQQNGGFRPGKKWPQFMAASLGTEILVYMFKVLNHLKHCA